MTQSTQEEGEDCGCMSVGAKDVAHARNTLQKVSEVSKQRKVIHHAYVVHDVGPSLGGGGGEV